MVEEALHVIRLRNDFYRDGFRKMAVALGVMVTTVVLLIAALSYLLMTKPAPVTFATDNEWRVLPSVPLNKPYLNTADLLQWVSATFSTVFNFDFLNYASKHADYEQYFTENGLKKYNQLLSDYVPAAAVQNLKAVVTGFPSGGPVVINQNVLAGRYAWWVEIPVKIDFSGYNKTYSQHVVLQVLVVRVPTLNRLSGVAIENLLRKS